MMFELQQQSEFRNSDRSEVMEQIFARLDSRLCISQLLGSTVSTDELTVQSARNASGSTVLTLQFPAANAPMAATTPQARANLLSMEWLVCFSRMWAWWKMQKSRTGREVKVSNVGVVVVWLFWNGRFAEGKLTQEGSGVDGGAEEGALRRTFPTCAGITRKYFISVHETVDENVNQAVFSPDGGNQTAAGGMVPPAEAFTIPEKHTSSILETHPSVDWRREEIKHTSHWESTHDCWRGQDHTYRETKIFLYLSRIKVILTNSTSIFNWTINISLLV